MHPRALATRGIARTYSLVYTCPRSSVAPPRTSGARDGETQRNLALALFWCGRKCCPSTRLTAAPAAVFGLLVEDNHGESSARMRSSAVTPSTALFLCARGRCAEVKRDKRQTKLVSETRTRLVRPSFENNTIHITEICVSPTRLDRIHGRCDVIHHFKRIHC